MASPEVLNFAQLVAPIPGQLATGTNPREDFSPTAPYRLLKDARMQVRAQERKLLAGGEEPSAEATKWPDWQPIVEGAQKILCEKAKDMEVVAWLIEGLAREHGFPGLRDGFRLARELAETHWDGLYPTSEGADLTARMAALGGLNGDTSDGTLILPIGNVPITEGRTAGPFTRGNYQQAAELDQLTDPEKRRKLIDQGAVTMDKFVLAVNETSGEFFRNLLDDLTACQAEFGKLCATLDARCPKDAGGQPQSPPSSRIRKALDDCVDVVKNVAKDKLLMAQASAQHAPGQADAAGDDSPSAGRRGASGAIQSREDAFRDILRIASFFKQTEPQGLVWYALEQAVKWGRMPLPDLLAEFVPEESARTRFNWLGVSQPKQEQK